MKKEYIQPRFKEVNIKTGQLLVSSPYFSISDDNWGGADVFVD